jgi:acetolactate synthase-1/2/3 large subunit
MTVGTTATKESKLLFGGDQTTVAKGIVEVLREAGIDFVFGIPGGNTVHSVYPAIDEIGEGIRVVLVREESLAGVMAEVYGRLTGRPGVVIAQGAWVMAHASIGTLEAKTSASPMLLLGDLTEAGPNSHHGPFQSGSGDYGSWDARQSLSGVTKATMVPTSGAQAVQLTQLAIKHAIEGEPGPVAVLYPEPVLEATIDPTETPRTYRTQFYLDEDRRGADAERIETAVEQLRSAKRPLIIAGGGVRSSGAYAELRELAELLGAPVTTTVGGKSAIPETHDLSVGLFGPFGQAVANAVVAEADVILVVGSKLGYNDTDGENQALIDPDRQQLIQVDIEPKNAGWTMPVSLALIGDARTTLASMADAVRAGGTVDNLQERAAYVAEARSEHGFFEDEKFHAESAPVLPQRLIREIQLAVDDDAIICCDAGENRIYMAHHFQTKSCGTFIQAAGIGAMGYAIPAALAAKLVHPERQSLAVCGDGGFGMTMNGLLTARDENIPIVVVVMNNSALGWVKHEQVEMSREVACDFGPTDHAEIARSFGCLGWRVERSEDLRDALAEALASDRPAVVDVVTTLEESYRSVVAEIG